MITVQNDQNIELSILEKLLKNNVGRYVIIKKLTIRDYYMLGMTNKYIYKLLKMDLYKNVINEVQSSLDYSYPFSEITEKEFNWLLIPLNQREIIMKNSITPMVTLTSDLLWENFCNVSKFVSRRNNDLCLYQKDKKSNKIIKSFMIPIIALDNGEKYYETSIKIIDNLVSVGIAPIYQYLTVQKYGDISIVFAVFDKKFKSLSSCILDNFHNKPLFKKIVTAIYDFSQKFSRESVDNFGRLGNYINFMGDYVMCDINNNDVHIYMTRYDINIVGNHHYMNLDDDEYIQIYINEIIDNIKKELIYSKSMEIESIINELTRVFH